MDAKRPTPKHVIIKMPKVKDKERILKAARENQRVTDRGVPIRLSADSHKKLCRLERAGKKYSKNLQPRLLYPPKVSFRMERQIK